MDLVTRLVTLDDAPALTRIVCEDRDFLAPWEPLRDADWYTLDGQRQDIRAALARHDQETSLPHVILDASNRVVGRIALSGVTRGALQSCSVGYWVSASANGRGLATSAVREMLRIAFEDLRLHRVQAETLLHNAASQRVLERNGFVQYGLAPQYLNIAGRWQDHLMFQVLNSQYH